MPIYPRGSTYLVSIGSGSNRIRRSCKTLEEAQLVEKRELLIREGVIEAPKQSSTRFKSGTQGVGSLETLKDAYRLTIRDTWSQLKSTASIKAAGHILDMLGDDTPVKEITTATIRELVDEMEDMGNTGATINKKLSALSMMLKTAADEGWIDTLPRIKRRSQGTHRVRWLDVEEELKVLNMCDKLGFSALKDFVICAMDTGFRKSELLNFRSNQYRDGRLHLHPDETKTSKPRSVPATDRVHDILMSRRHNARTFNDLTHNKLRDAWDYVRAELGKTDDPQFVVHMLRHTCASRLAMQDKSAQFIQEWMGHATPLTTARYMHLAPAKLKEGKAALEEYRRVNQPFPVAVNQ